MTSQSEKFQLRQMRNTSPHMFIRYLCRGMVMRNHNREIERASETFVVHCQELYDQQCGLCAVSGFEMTFSSRPSDKSQQISINRIDSSRGYIPGNVRLVCYYINNAMAGLGVSELLRFVIQIMKHHKLDLNFSNDKKVVKGIKSPLFLVGQLMPNMEQSLVIEKGIPRKLWRGGNV